MDGAEACDLYSAVEADAKPRRVGGRGVRGKTWSVSPGETDSSADLGDSSNYSNENFED